MKKTDFSQPVKNFIKPVDTVLYPNQTIQESVESIKKVHTDEKIIYFYVVDENRKLLGVVSTRELLLKDSDTKIRDIMLRPVVAVGDHQTLEETMHVMNTHHLLAIPVVDGHSHLLGVVDVRLYVEEHMEVRTFRAKEDIFQMLGFVIAEGNHRNFLSNYLHRMPWIMCNMVGGIACAIISRVYQDVLTKAIVLAMFIPLVLSLSESISMQTMTHSFIFMRKHRLKWKEVIKRVAIESRVLVFLALSCSAIVGVTSVLWNEGLENSMIIALGILFSVFVSGCIGAFIPFVLHARNMDPKVAAGPLVLSIADIVTTLIYLSIAAKVLY